MRFLNKVIILAVLALLACPVWSAEPSDQYRPPDPICQALYDEYVLKGTKDAAGMVIPASEIIVARGRSTGFWKTVLAGLGEAKEGWDEVRYVRILGKMLTIDARGREIIESGNADKVQQSLGICLPKDVVPELIDRAQKSKDIALDAYTIALCRARDTRAKELFLDLLKQNDIDVSVQFHAALGLAELGDTTGVDWLIAHSDDDSANTVSLAWPQYVPDHSIGASCVAALGVLSGQRHLKTKAEFAKWWKTASKDWSPNDHVYLEDK
jgi:hypothetical protein